MNKSTFIGILIVLIIGVLISAVSIALGFWLAPGYMLYKALSALLGFAVCAVVLLILSIAYKMVNR